MLYPGQQTEYEGYSEIHEDVPVETPQKIVNCINKWKGKLIDFSKRNRLLYFKFSSGQDNNPNYIELKNFPENLMNDLLNGKYVDFQDQNLITHLDQGKDKLILQEEADRPNGQKTPLKIKTIQKFFRKDREMETEMGLNTLFLAFGFLEWHEGFNNPNEPLIHHSPLFLIPLDIERTGMSHENKYAFCLDEDENIEFNPVLKVYLQRIAQHIDLSFLENIEDELNFQTLNEFLQDIDEKVSSISGWSVQYRACISTFVFQKMPIYVEIEQHLKEFSNQPLIRKLCLKEPFEQGNYLGAKEIDLKPSMESFCITDADSSQIEAIHAASEGKSFVLDGPPGTGKSQTIVNIIGELIAHGKRVLFVSQKKAALDVVIGRLKNCGNIDKYCLDLHGNGLNGKELIKKIFSDYCQLNRANCMSSENEDHQDLFYRLDRIKAKLNDYVEFIKNSEFAKYTPHELYSRAAELSHIENIEFNSNKSVREVDDRFIKDAKELIQKLSTFESIYLAEPEHPWCTLKQTEHISISSTSQLESTLKNLLDKLVKFSSDYSNLEETGVLSAFGIEKDQLFPDVQNTLEHLQCFIENPQNDIPNDFLCGDCTLDQLEEKILVHQKFHKDILAIQSIVGEYARPVPSQNVIDSLLQDLESILQDESSFIGAINIDKLREIHDTLKPVYNSFLKELESVRCLDFPFPFIEQLEKCPSIADYEPYIELILHILGMPKAMPKSFLDPKRMPELEGKLDADIQEHADILKLKKEVLAYSAGEITERELEQLSRKITNSFSQYFWFLRFDLHKLLKDRFYDKNYPLPSRYQDILRDLASMQDLLAKLSHLENHKSHFKQSYGDSYKGLETDWETISKAISWCKKLFELEEINNVSLNIGLLTRFQRSASSGSEIRREQLSSAWQEFYEKYESLMNRFSGVLSSTLHVSSLLSAIDRRLSFDARIKNELYSSDTKAAKDLAQIQKHLTECQELINKTNELKRRVQKQDFLVYGSNYCELDTDWYSMRSKIIWLKELCKRFNLESFSSPLRQFLIDNDRLKNFTANLSALQTLWLTIQQDIVKLDEFLDKNSWQFLSLKSAIEKTINYRENLHRIEEWFNWLDLKRQFAKNGLEKFLQDALSRQNKLSIPDLTKAFEKRIYLLILDEIERQYPEIKKFDGASWQELINNFKQYDRRQFEVNRQRIAVTILENFNKQQKISKNLSRQIHDLEQLAAQKRPRAKRSSLRRLLKDWDTLLCAMYPCWMMSPLNVSKYIPFETKFDAIIFDESSQLSPEDAISSIFRGQQVIICGDPEQMPPTKFGMGSYEDEEDEEDEEDTPEEYESILNECMPVLDQKRLLWHYRSKYEELIRPSNEYIYDGELVTFPADHNPKHKPIEFQYVEEGKFINRSNRSEAQQLVKKLIDIFGEMKEQGSRKSVGIIAFGKSQQECIQEEIRRVASANREDRNLLNFLDFESCESDALFVKNLETSQGDERDIILLSIGYGKNNEGKLIQRFGPINQSVGYRRLNVAFTRAKERVIIFSSFKHHELRVDEETSSRGLKFLKDYLCFADTGELKERRIFRTENCESPLEKQVMIELQKMGYEVRAQVGCSGYRIDLAVLCPQRKNSFILGIECDGATYHSAPTARDRDRLRQQILESKGWHIHRIWSRDWWKNKAGEIYKLKKRIEEEASKILS